MVVSFNTIKVYVTSSCNLNCRHCYQYQDKNRYQLENGTLSDIINYAEKTHTEILDFSGGEFFTHPYSYDLLNECFSKGIHVNLATNGILVQPSFFKSIATDNLLTVQFSVDGMEQSHDYRRGSGTFKKMMDNVKALHNMGITLTANMVLDETNIMDAISVIQLPYFSQVTLLPIAYHGAAKPVRNKQSLASYERTMCYLLENTECNVEEFHNEIFPNTLAIRYDGNVYPSPAASDYDLFCFGNVNDASIGEIVDKFFYSSTYAKLSSINNDNIQECNNCPSNTRCNRGCRFRALKFHGDMMKPDPFYCRIFEHNYKDIPLGQLFWGDQ